MHTYACYHICCPPTRNPADGVYPVMSTDYVSFSIIHCLARLVFLHSFISSSVVDYLSNSLFDSYHHLSPNNSQDEALL